MKKYHELSVTGQLIELRNKVGLDDKKLEDLSIIKMYKKILLESKEELSKELTESEKKLDNNKMEIECLQDILEMITKKLEKTKEQDYKRKCSYGIEFLVYTEKLQKYEDEEDDTEDMIRSVFYDLKEIEKELINIEDHIKSIENVNLIS